MFYSLFWKFFSDMLWVTSTLKPAIVSEPRPIPGCHRNRVASMVALEHWFSLAWGTHGCHVYEIALKWLWMNSWGTLAGDMTLSYRRSLWNSLSLTQGLWKTAFLSWSFLTFYSIGGFIPVYNTGENSR